MTYYLTYLDGSVKEVTVNPYESEDPPVRGGTLWYYPLELSGAGNEEIVSIYGVLIDETMSLMTSVTTVVFDEIVVIQYWPSSVEAEDITTDGITASIRTITNDYVEYEPVVFGYDTDGVCFTKNSDEIEITETEHLVLFTLILTEEEAEQAFSLSMSLEVYLDESGTRMISADDFTDTKIVAQREFSIYSTDDNSVRYYNRVSALPSVGDTYEGLVVSEIESGIYIQTSVREFRWRTATTIIAVDEWVAPSILSYAFYYYAGNSSFETIDLSKWDVSKVTNMNYMFYNASYVTTLNLDGWDVSNVKSMNYMFYNACWNMTLDLSNWNTASLTTAQHFASNSDCSFKLDGFKMPSSVSNMFQGYAGSELDLSVCDWSRVTGDLKYMFYKTSATTIKFPTTKLSTTSLYSTFYEYKGTELDLSFINPEKLTNLITAFRSATKLRTIYASESLYSEDRMSAAPSQTFYNCNSLIGGNGTTLADVSISGIYAVIDTDDTPGLLTYKEASE